MKYIRSFVICALTAICATCQAQPVCAQEMIEENLSEKAMIEEIPIVQVSEDLPAAEDNQTEELPTEDAPTEEIPPEETLQELPQKVTGLHTTCQSDRKVLLEWDESEGAAYYNVYRRKGNGDYNKLDEVTKTAYTDASVVYGKTYDYKIVPVNQAGEEGEAAAIQFFNARVVTITKQKYSYHQMETDMRALAKKYSNYCELTSIGMSVEGRTIYDFAIGDPDAQRSLLVVSTLHAREYICSAVLIQEIEYYLQNYHRSLSGTIPADLLKNMQIHYILMANPDGVTISQTKYARWKANSRGVDLNCNFPVEKFTVSGKRGAAGYSGKKALSEPESKAIAAFTKNLKNNQQLLGVINYHAMGQIVFGDCNDKKLKKDTQTMYRIARGLTGYRDSGGYSSGKPSGGGQYREYVMDLLKLPSITIEMGATSAPCAYWEYASAFQKNKLVVLKIADAL